MRAGRSEERETRGRPLSHREFARISPLPPPEEVFADWLVSVPPDVDLVVAAREQVRLIDRGMPLHPDLLCLRALLVAVAGGVAWIGPVPNL